MSPFCRAEEQCVMHSKFNLHAAGSVDGREAGAQGTVIISSGLW